MEVSSLPLALLLVTLSMWGDGVYGSPPEAVVKCKSGNVDCTVTNGYGAFPDRTTCRVAAVAYPSSENELLQVVSNATVKKQHMKVVTVYSHSIPKLSCPGGPAGAGLVIGTHRLNRLVAVDAAAYRMTLESGITLRQLIDAAAARGLALPYTPYWQGMTLGGLLGTGSHGSSLFGKGSAVHERVVGMRLVVPSSDPVDGTGLHARIVDLGEDDPDLLAAKVSLGVLGVISQITLQLEPMFKRSITNRVEGDVDFESTVASFAATTEFGDITWYPGQRQVVFRDDERLPVSAPGNGKNNFIGFRPQLPVILGANRGLEEHMEVKEDSLGKCLLAHTQVTFLLLQGAGLENNDGSVFAFTGYPVIGNHSDVQSSGSCLESNEHDEHVHTACPWDPRFPGGLFFHQTAVSIPIPNVTSFVADVKKLRDLRPDSLCGLDLYSGFLMRFVRDSTAYLGKTSDSVDVDMTYFRSRDPNEPRLDQDVLEEVEQMALFKYKGLPHWGKNRNIGFLGIREKLGTKGDKFVAAMEKFDKDGLFSSDWTDAVLGLRGKSLVIERDGCALEGLCICSHDRHCKPSDGYFCRPGLVYPEARVCRKTNDVFAPFASSGLPDSMRPTSGKDEL